MRWTVDLFDRRADKLLSSRQLYRSVPGHGHHSEGKVGHDVPGVVPPGSTGVIYVSERAQANGWSEGHPEWANFVRLSRHLPWRRVLSTGRRDAELTCSRLQGQGAPEVGHIPGSSPRPDNISLAELSKVSGGDVNEYASTTGVKKLREAVAQYYNDTYRQGKESQ